MKDLNFLEAMKFDREGLIPAIIQDVNTKAVLMMAYMNKEALKRTWETGETWFYSRSRQELWHKGETSGHTQRVREISFDCDRDTILVKVEPVGPACHEGYISCFFREINSQGEMRTIAQKVFDPDQVYREEIGAKLPEQEAEVLTKEKQLKDTRELSVLTELYQVIKERQVSRPEGSYTAYLFNQGIDKICKKVGEEAAEVIIGAKNRNSEELIYESADLLYHLLVLLAEAGVTPEEVMQELAKRR
ncbi:MAG: bifunctional phosphoribosyl-AMP cyclohydrolase/phosphoribosyl-ATP diphosphatase HisIE [Syntrophomonadaceae bacterium]|nr:bifunctional phosphoribosyl-AMP cyclohydrolase/phosphoribosyl-ATP diphosphatase HisIE [Syntrophomonadaceae bacterium]